MKRKSCPLMLAAPLFAFIGHQTIANPQISTTIKDFEIVDDRSNNSGRKSCGSLEPGNLAEYQRSVERFEKFKEAGRRSDSRNRSSGSATIPVHFHVIQSSYGDGQLTDADLDAQIEVMNNGFSGKDTYSCDNRARTEKGSDTPFRFNKVGVGRVTNDYWFRTSTSNEMEMKTALRQGGCDTLNIYTSKPAYGYLGWATFPQDCASSTTLDGVVVDYTTFPNGSYINYDLGDTCTHEIGHWMGLFHTFHGGCSSGDGVSDTPAEGYSTFGCPVNKNTCPGPGDDPTFNFMDYSDDCCMHRFTPGQRDKMDSNHQDYRLAHNHFIHPTPSPINSLPDSAPTLNPTPSPINSPPDSAPTLNPTTSSINSPPDSAPTLNPTHSLINSPPDSAPTLNPTSSPINSLHSAPKLKNCQKRKNMLKVEISADFYGWKIKDSSGDIIETGDNYGLSNPNTFEKCLLEDCYTFTIKNKDVNGHSKGSYKVIWKGVEIISVGKLKALKTVRFGCPKSSTCKKSCKKNAHKSMKNECLKRRCGNCDACNSFKFACKKICNNGSSELSKKPWSKRCTEKKCAGCPVCNL